MDGTIQEEDIFKSLIYTKRLKEDLLVLQAQRNNEFNMQKNKCLERIKEEKLDIETLNNKNEQCLNNIAKNNERLSVIPKEINDLEDDIEYCNRMIDCTEVPVYREYYDDYYETWRSEIDYSATRANEDYIESLRETIETDRRGIEQLTQEQNRRRNNIDSLKRMIDDIKNIIERKQKLINELNDAINHLEEAITKLTKSINSNALTLDELTRNLNYARELINKYGMNVAKTYYKNFSNAYAANMKFLASSDALNQVIAALKSGSDANMLLLNQMNNATKLFCNLLQDNVTDEADNIINKSIKTQNGCYESVVNNIKYLKEANQCLLTYERINF